ncbi:HAD hydrolase-like protein [Paenibacillus rhizovicinus]|uniref:HAD hydrolase-like protein n=1 Tax=Paenibacillus rhizovicinus TaxID=2704463 RepID=A0A6C0P4W9_9BACL|nr:HAD hydrolase-like protein [Paenibacillus rhizovicinus]QHW32873.1 HAD hydrolase-like protein [Paenibacillus rhizovicinus]
MKPYVVFDFDGTIVQSKMLAVRLFNELSAKYGGRQIEDEEISRLSDLSIPDRLKALQVPLYKMPALVMEGKRRYREELSSLQPVSGIREAFVRLKENGHKLGILSSNTMDNIRGFLALHELAEFDVVHSATNMFGKDKAIRKMARSLDIGLDQLVYIGDELRDVQACRKIGVPIIAVTWGLDSAALLAEAGPDFLCHSAAELSGLIAKGIGTRG